MFLRLPFIGMSNNVATCSNLANEKYICEASVPRLQNERLWKSYWFMAIFTFLEKNPRISRFDWFLLK